MQLSHKNLSAYIPSAAAFAARDFVAIDFETANKLGGVSACALAAVRFVDGKIVDKWQSLICPPVGYRHFDFTYIHGLSYEDVAESAAWPELVDSLTEFIGNSITYAHWAKFDATVWKQLDSFYNTSSMPKSFYCSCLLAKSLLPELINHKLPTVVRAVAPDFQLQHHNALSDAIACGLIVDYLQNSISFAF